MLNARHRCMQHKKSFTTYTKMAGALTLALALTGTPTGGQMQIITPGGEPLQLPAGRQNKTGTGRIKGRLVNTDTGGPVRRAQVRLTGTDVMPRVATTDHEGNYEFRDLPAGRFTITAVKTGYVNIGYGQTRPFEAPKPIELGEGQMLEKVDFAMPRGSAISGRIIDEFGEPVADASVTASRSIWSNGRRRLQSTGRASTTNDLGQYRIYGLPPGEYILSATLRGGQEMMVMEMAVVATRMGGPEPEAPRSGYAPTYFPGTANGNEAQRVALAVGQEVQNADFSLLPVRLSKVTGSVVGSDGRPMAGVMVSTVPRNRAETSYFTFGGGARTDRNGNFTLNSVAPGDYMLQARGSHVMTTTGDGEARTMVFTMAGGGEVTGDGTNEFGSVPLAVAGEDISNVIIVTTKGTTASGRVVWEGGAKPSANTLRISATSNDGENPLMAAGGSSSVNAEGRFELKGLAGHRMFRVSNVPTGWVLKAIRHNGTDITDEGIEIRSEAITGLEVVLTSNSNEVTGSVKSGNEPATDYTVVIFSQDAGKWSLPMTRHVHSARPNQEGRFHLRNLPAGDYYAIALDYVAQGEWNDPENLAKLKAKAKSFTLDESGVQTLDLALEEGGN